jgi:hypothetical protein
VRMTPALALSALLWLPATPAQPAGAAAFQPRFHVSFQPAVSRPLPRDGDDELVCGIVVIHKTPDVDPKMLLPAREAGAAVRRIEPQDCRAKATVTRK